MVLFCDLNSNPLRKPFGGNNKNNTGHKAAGRSSSNNNISRGDLTNRTERSRVCCIALKVRWGRTRGPGQNGDINRGIQRGGPVAN